MNELTDRIRAAINREHQRTDWPHRPQCQMLQPVPPGFPYPILTCNCDGADRWWRLHKAGKEILDLHDEQTDPCGGEGLSSEWPCPTLLALGEALGIEAGHE